MLYNFLLASDHDCIC